MTDKENYGNHLGQLMNQLAESVLGILVTRSIQMSGGVGGGGITTPVQPAVPS
jgi:hypothetical protein